MTVSPPRLRKRTGQGARRNAGQERGLAIAPANGERRRVYTLSEGPAHKPTLPGLKLEI